jgi:PAS domain S-box-containing protein
MTDDRNEDQLLRSVALQNAAAVLAARRRVEEELAAERERLRVTLASIGDAVISTDADGRVVYLNAVAEALTGWAQTEAVGRPLSDVFPIVNEHTRRPVENPALRALREGAVVALTNHTVLIARDGTERPIDDSAAPMWDTSGAPIGAVLVFRDVTERRRAEEVRARLAAIVESSEDAIVSKTLDGVVRSWNAGAERLFGYAPAEMIGRPITIIIPPERLDEEQMILERLRRGERVEHFETVRVARDGRRLEISLTVSPVRDPEGRVIGASKVARDITGRKRAEADLRESEERQRKLADNLPSGFIYQIVHGAGGDRRFNYVSRGVEPLCGVSPEEVIIDPIRLYGLILPEDADRVRATEEDAFRTRTQFDCRFRMRRAGRVVWLHCRSAPRYLPDGGAVWDGIAMDVTEQVLAEEALRAAEEQHRKAAAEAARAAEANAKFRTFFEQGANFAGVLSLDGVVVEANRLCLDACGFTRDEVIGKPFWECGWWSPAPDLMEMVRGACTQAVAGRPFRTETRYFVASGAERVVDLIVAPVTDGAGRALFLAATGTDVTERRAMEDALRDTDRRKDEFIALLAHELRNPLAPLRNGLEIMRLAGDGPDFVAKARDRMDRQLSHLVRLVDDLLDVSRINRGKMELRRSRVRLADIIGSAVETARPVIDASAHELTVELPDGPVLLDADLTRLAQVFANLLTNSAKYTERGGKIWLTAVRAGAEVVLTVRDTGIGIPTDALPRIFDMFSQVDRSIEKSTGGLGIGLALVRGLVEMHGGTVTADSGGPGAGSTFTVRLPALSSDVEGPSTDPVVRLGNSGRAGRRVLVVDDNRDGAESLAEMLQLLGHEVHTAHDGVEAVEVSERLRPDLVLMDVGMPRLNGLDATRRIRERPWGRAVTVIALTGWGQEADRERSKEAGCDGHLVKPVGLAELERLLSSLPCG